MKLTLTRRIEDASGTTFEFVNDAGVNVTIRVPDAVQLEQTGYQRGKDYEVTITPAP